MIFYVYIDPAIIAAANQGGIYAVQSIIGILHGFLQNCFLAEFDDYRIQQNVKDHVDSLPSGDAKKRIEVIFETLKKRHRFIYCLASDCLDRKSSLECVFDQQNKVNLDLLLVCDDDLEQGHSETEMASLGTYQTSNFERRRSALASAGMAFSDGELDQGQFINQVFLKALRFASRIEICDGIFGRKFSKRKNDNFKYSIQTLFEYLAEYLPENLEVIIHCEKNKDQDVNKEIVKTFAALKEGQLSTVKFELHFYQDKGWEKALPHQRYLFTDQIAFQIDPGIDFIRERTRKNREFSINYKDLVKVREVIRLYSSQKLQPVVSI